MRAYDIGLSALRSHTRTLNTIGNNIANSATPGYHRQRVNLISRLPEVGGNNVTGEGVEVGSVRRVIDIATEDAILRNKSLAALNDTDLELAREIETLFSPGESGIHEALSGFFNDLESVANAPEVTTIRSELLVSAQGLLDQFSGIHKSLIGSSSSRVSELQDTVDEINTAVAEIAELNKSIQLERGRGLHPNALLDRRDNIVERLAQWTDVAIVRTPANREVVMVGNILAVGELPHELEVVRTQTEWQVQLKDTDTPVSLSTGRIGGLLEAVNSTIPDAIQRLSDVSDTIVRNIDQQHAKGLTGAGAHDVIRGQRVVPHPNTPLYKGGLWGPVSVGEVTITVTDGTTGNRTSHRIAVDPYTESMTDITAKFDAVPGITAYFNTDTGRLTISGDGANRIDFAGRVDDVPDLTSFSGSSVPQFSGTYLGEKNSEWTVSVNGSGTIGVTDGLTATVTNENGQTIGTVNVGAGYEAGIPLSVADGVSLQFGSGTVLATDTATVPLTANSDTAGLLSALGLNSFFAGTNVSGYQLRADLVESPDLFATSVSGHVGDANNFQALTELRDIRFEGLDDRTFIEELADFTADSGLRAAQAINDKEQLESHGIRLNEQREAVSGVSTEEEFLHMLEVERAFQAAARFITTADETLAEVMRLIQ